MAELSKYEYILDELNSLEKHISFMSKKNKELNSKVSILEKINAEMAAENSELNKKIMELETKIEIVKKEQNGGKNGNLLNTKEKEQLKIQITDLINKIDFHLRS